LQKEIMMFREISAILLNKYVTSEFPQFSKKRNNVVSGNFRNFAKKKMSFREISANLQKKIMSFREIFA